MIDASSNVYENIDWVMRLLVKLFEYANSSKVFHDDCHCYDYDKDYYYDEDHDND